MASDTYYHDNPPYPSAPAPSEQYSSQGPPPAVASTQQTPYPAQYASDQVSMPQPQPQPQLQPQAAATSLPQYPAATPPPHVQGPRDQPAGAVPNYLSPELISQVTATVIQQLRAYGLDSPQPQTYAQAPPPPPPPVHPYYSPPPQSPPQPPSQPATYGRTDSPGVGRAPAPYAPPGSERWGPGPASVSSMTPPRTSPRPATAERSDAPPDPVKERPSPDRRPSPLKRVSTSGEETTLEKIWGKLFEDGRPTARLGQFLRGIAVHLIEDYPPGNTLVVTPEKMQKFYADTAVSQDPWPWQDIFDDRTSSISRLYREIEAEHHLFQIRLNERPDVPGLTPRGFERWMTWNILARPETEFTRMQKAVLNLPISNPDNRRERFPKELPRRLFPSNKDPSILKKLMESIRMHCVRDLPDVPAEPRSSSTPPAQPSKASADEPQSARLPHNNNSVSTPARDRPPRNLQAHVDDVEDDDEEGPPRPIERERKPYSAQPGGGKVYDEPSSSRDGPGRPKDKDFLATPTRHRASHSYGGQERPHVRVSGSQPSPTMRSGRMRSSSVGLNERDGGDYRRSDSQILGMKDSLYEEVLEPESILDDFGDSRRYRDYDSGGYGDGLGRDRDWERRYHDSGSGRYDDEDWYRGAY